METQSSRPVVVGVTGAGENTAALRFALERAKRDDCGVIVVHAIHQVLPPPPSNLLISFPPLEEVGRTVVSEVLQEAATLSEGSVPIHGEARSGYPVQVLTELSGAARSVIVQHRDLSKMGRLFTGSTTIGVAAHASCPVTSVPAEWTPRESHGWVTVGVHEQGVPLSVLEASFVEAAATGSGLRVVQAWHLENVYDDIIRERVGDQWREHSEASLLPVLEPLKTRFPTVTVETQLRHQRPAEALVDLSRQSDLLVIGRHAQHPPLPHRIGSMARTLIRESRCPLMVVPVERGSGHASGHGNEERPRA